jgi:cytidine deaminase
MDFTVERSELTEQDRQLLREAIETSDRLYLENIHEVAAAVRTTGGEVFSGIHFETAVGWANVCGEVAAICCMVSAGHRDLDTVVAVWRDPSGQHFLLPPCGRCREVISDFNREAWVIVSTKTDPWEVGSVDTPCKVRVSDLLPLKPP